MPRRNKVHKTLVKPRPAFLKERDDSRLKIEACLAVLDSVLKSRSSVRKNEYKEQLTRMIESLAIDSTDLQETRAQRDEARAKFERADRLRCEATDKLLRYKVKHGD